MNVQVKFDANGNGFLEVWRDGVQIVDYHGAIGSGGAETYWKEGVLPRAGGGSNDGGLSKPADNDRSGIGPHDTDQPTRPRRRRRRTSRRR